MVAVFTVAKTDAPSSQERTTVFTPRASDDATWKVIEPVTN